MPFIRGDSAHVRDGRAFRKWSRFGQRFNRAKIRQYLDPFRWEACAKKPPAGSLTRCNHACKSIHILHAPERIAIEIGSEERPWREAPFCHGSGEATRIDVFLLADFFSTLEKECVGRTYCTIVVRGHHRHPVVDASLKCPQVLNVVYVHDIGPLVPQDVAYLLVGRCVVSDIGFAQVRRFGRGLPERRISLTEEYMP